MKPISKNNQIRLGKKSATKKNTPFTCCEETVGSFDAEVVPPSAPANQSSNASAVTHFESPVLNTTNVQKFEHYCGNSEGNSSKCDTKRSRSSALTTYPDCKQQIKTVTSFSDIITATEDGPLVYLIPYFKDVPFALDFTEVEFPSDSLYYLTVRHMRCSGFEVITGRLTDIPGEPYIVLFETESVKEKYNRVSELMQDIKLPELVLRMSDTEAFELAVERFCKNFSYECTDKKIFG